MTTSASSFLNFLVVIAATEISANSIAAADSAQDYHVTSAIAADLHTDHATSCSCDRVPDRVIDRAIVLYGGTCHVTSFVWGAGGTYRSLQGEGGAV